LAHSRAFASVVSFQKKFLPESGVNRNSVIGLLNSKFRFTSFDGPAENLVFQVIPPITLFNGIFSDENNNFPISSVRIEEGGIAIASQNTNQVDRVLESVIELLGTQLHFRFEDAQLKKIYLSNLVCKFDSGIEEYVSALARVQSAISSVASDDPFIEKPFNLKRLAFGTSPDALPPQVTIQTIKDVDFLIERRAGHPFEENVYYSSAPLTTPKHTKALRLIENAMTSPTSGD
jgi:hypothetical protein